MSFLFYKRHMKLCHNITFYYQGWQIQKPRSLFIHNSYNKMLRPNNNNLKSIHRRLKMSKTSDKLYDLVVYGATGFTGQFVVEEVARVAALENKKGQELKWAIAGRNVDKLKAVLESSGKYMGQSLEIVPIISANNQDEKSLSDMTSQAKVIINCVGPYHIYGEPVVKACIQSGTSHVDISGEPHFLEKMQLDYDEEAEKAGAHIIGACGYDSIPADVGLCHLAKNFPGVLNSAECILNVEGGSARIHTGTMESAASVIANTDEIRRLRTQLFPTRLTKPKFKKEERGIFYKNDELNKWCLPLPSDESVVYRTQRYLQSHKGLRPIQFKGFVAFQNIAEALATFVGILYFLAVCYFSWTRKILFKYPGLMTAGVFTSAGPEREKLESMRFTSTIIGKGWSEKLPENAEDFSSPPDTKVVLKIEGGDPGYGATSLMMVASAMTILREKSSLERPGGVMTPGTAFMNTKIIDRLIEGGMKVTLEKEENH